MNSLGENTVGMGHQNITL